MLSLLASIVLVIEGLCSLCHCSYEKNSSWELIKEDIEFDSDDFCNKKITKYVERDKVLGEHLKFCLTLTGKHVALGIDRFCDTWHFYNGQPILPQHSTGNIS